LGYVLGGTLRHNLAAPFDYASRLRSMLAQDMLVARREADHSAASRSRIEAEEARFFFGGGECSLRMAPLSNEPK
jgi:hypothetical protein